MKKETQLDLITDNNRNEWCKLGWERDDNRYVYDEIFIGDEKYEFESGEENLKRYLHVASHEWLKILICILNS